MQVCLFQALPETIRELKTALWNAELSGGVANLTGALTTGFEILHRVRNTLKINEIKI